MRAVNVTVTMKSGEKHTHQQLYRSGHWKNPLSDETLRDKFRDLAGRVLTEAAVKSVEATVASLEKQAQPGPSLGAALQDLRG
jgi:2-methylcitrate dehydratase PrpD